MVTIAIHPSQFPEAINRDLIESLRTRQINHKFHYESIKQTQKWLALHRAHSPWRTDPDCAAIYERSYVEVVKHLETTQRVHLISLGCGDGSKDARLLGMLRDAGKELHYTPTDVGVAMVLMARQSALSIIPAQNCSPVVCDLATSDDLHNLHGLLQDKAQNSKGAPLIAFFGMMPNFEPEIILPRLARLLPTGGVMLASANLAPGADYAAGVKRILPLYDNELTSDWLLTFLYDLGVEKNDGDLRFVVDDGQNGLKRVAAYYSFNTRRSVELNEQRFDFAPGECLRLFFSYRHTPSLLRALFAPHGLRVLAQRITRSEEEGVFLIGR